MSEGPRTLDQFDIRGRSALVTGAASGIGLGHAFGIGEADAAGGAGNQRRAAANVELVEGPRTLAHRYSFGLIGMPCSLQ